MTDMKAAIQAMFPGATIISFDELMANETEGRFAVPENTNMVEPEKEADHPSDCLCGVNFIDGVSEVLPVAGFDFSNLRATDKVRFNKMSGFTEWGEINRNYCINTYFAFQIQQREDDKPKADVYYLYVGEELIRIGKFANEVDALDQIDIIMPDREGVVVSESEIESIIAQYQKIKEVS